MNWGLSAWKYIKNNKKTAATLVTALAVACMSMYVVYSLLITTSESFETVMRENSKKVSFVSISAKTLGIKSDDYKNEEDANAAFDEKQNKLAEYLKNKEGIEDAFFTLVIAAMYHSVIGEYAYEMPLMEPERIQGFLNHTEATLVEGKMPEKEGDILIDDVIRKNGGYQVGDWFEKETYGETFKISGVIKSKSMVCVGVPRGYTNNGWYIVIYNNESVTNLKPMLREYGLDLDDADEVWDADEYIRMYKLQVGDTIDMVISSICGVIMFFLGILVIVVYVSFMRNRVNEYCLYASIGYGRRMIYGMIMREMMMLFSIGTVIGLLISFFVTWVLNVTIISPKGLIGHIVYPEQIATIIGIYVFLMGILQLPVLWSLKKIKTIDAIEE